MVTAMEVLRRKLQYYITIKCRNNYNIYKVQLFVDLARLRKL